ncbi:MAG: DNA repair protein RecO [Blastocatellia bacterium]|nr:DNA repair protein RecO [Blastocatellia bacterium]
MPLHDTDAYVLRTFSIQEADKICVFFTRKEGKLRGVAQGARRMKSRYGASLEPFTEVSLVFFQKENRELVSISSCEILRSQFVEGLSSERLGLLHYLAELVIEFAPDHEPNDLVYRLISATMDALKDLPAEKLPALARYFEIWMLKLAGFFPDWRQCGACARDLEIDRSVWLTPDGSPLCADCSGRRGDELTPGEWRVIREILTQAPGRFVASPRDAREDRLLQLVGATAYEMIVRILERNLRSIALLDRLNPVPAARRR